MTGHLQDPNSRRATSLLSSALVWDNHCCLPLRSEDRFLPELDRLRVAGISVVSINVGYASMSLGEHLNMISYFSDWLARYPDKYCLVSTVEDIRCAKETRRLGVVFDVEGMCPVQDDPALVQVLYDRGVRWMLVAYNRNNLAGGGCLDVDVGLTTTGRRIIDEMERVGMVLCLSHTGARTAAEAIEYSKRPVIFSHSNPYGQYQHPRNISDNLIKACASTGGVIGLSGIGPFLGTNVGLVARLLQHLRYVIDLVGPNHVGLGLDYVFDRNELDEHVRANPSLYPHDLAAEGGLKMVEPECLSEIAEGLQASNLNDSEIRGVLGGNWLRVASDVWR